MIFERLTIPPLMVVLLLLYGLLIAFVLVLWTALDLRRRKRAGEGEQAGRTEAGRQAAPPARPRTEAPRLTASADPPAPAPEAARPPARRTADSDSVVSYSVRARVNGEPAPADSRERRTAPQQPAVATPPTEDSQPAEPRIGRGSRKPAADPRPVRTETARLERPAEPEQSGRQPGGTERRRSEDAFERFLRSSADDDDF